MKKVIFTKKKKERILLVKLDLKELNEVKNVVIAKKANLAERLSRLE
jgi:hypothetical protein